MSKVVSYTPEWLSRPSAGFDFLSSTSTAKPTSSQGLKRRLAHRGTEVFFAAGSELRWGDIHLLEDDFYAASGDETAIARGWRTLKTPVSRPIQQISISPDGRLLAVATSHTCHVCVLLAPSHLRSTDTSPLRLKTYQIGPTAHVLEQAPIVSILWHPLSAPGSQALVTVTRDAAVRLFELDTNNRHSFDQPGLAIDLKKLANATSTTTDITTSRFGVNRTFSPDDAEMEVAAACFGGQGLDDEHGWSSMTLWTAMTEGDVYALCPFLPSKFTLPSATLATLSTEVVSTAQLSAADQQASEAEQRKSNDQSAWIADTDGQDTLTVADEANVSAYEVYTRPQRPGAVAKLQGPFQLSSEPASLNITDIHVVAPTTNEDYLFDDDEDLADFNTGAGASIGIVCLATSVGQVHVSATLEAVSAEWLPHKRSRAISLDDSDHSVELLVLHTATLTRDDVVSTTAPVFSRSPNDRYEVFVTSASGIHTLDFKPWVYALEDELTGEGPSGVDFRLQMLLESSATTVRTILHATNTESFGEPAAAVAIDDAALGFFILTATSSGPHAALLDVPRSSAPFEPELLTIPAPEPRQSYQPAPAFFQPSDLTRSITERTNHPVHRAELAKQLRAKPETLQLLTDTHRLLSQETHRLGLAAADLFRRCERMRVELADQVGKVNEISQKTQATINAGADEVERDEANGDDSQIDAVISGRILQIQSNTDNMEERIKTLRANLLRLGGEELSVKERAYLHEVQQLQTLLGGDAPVAAPTDPGSLVRLPDHDADTSTPSTSQQLATSIHESNTFAARIKAAEQLRDSLIDSADTVLGRQQDQEVVNRQIDDAATGEYKHRKLAKVLEMLERETALIDAVSERLARLGGID